MESDSPALSPLGVRRAVASICTFCVAGMIVAAALKHLGGVIAFGCLSSAGIITLMAVIATQRAPQHSPKSPGSLDTEQAIIVESLVAETVAQGAHEPTVRSLVGAAIDLGKSFSAPVAQR